jgi:hypothetical protein
MKVMCTENKVDKWEAFKQFIRDFLLLHHAAANADYKLRLITFQLFKRADIAEYSLFRVLTYAAGIKKDNISLFF